MSYGVTPQGFVPKTLQVIRSELEADFRSRFGAGINLEPESVFGQIVGVFSERETVLWEAAEGVYAADRPDSSADASLDGLAALTGAARLPATKTRVAVTVSGTVGTVLPAGRVISVNGSGARFLTTVEATIGAGATVDVVCEAEEYGPVPCYAGTLTKIETPVSGWDSVTNAVDGAVGRAVETDADFRVRREALLRAQGNSAIDAIRADVLAVEGVESCTIFENPTASTDSEGMPPHSVEALVTGGADADIAAALLGSVSGGIETHGTTSVVVEDSQGVQRTIKFSRPADKNVYVTVHLVKNADFPADGADQIKAALVAYAAARLWTGDDVVSSAMYPATFSVAGVVDVTGILIGFESPPTDSATLPIGAREIARLDTSRIVVSAT